MTCNNRAGRKATSSHIKKGLAPKPDPKAVSAATPVQDQAGPSQPPAARPAASGRSSGQKAGPSKPASSGSGKNKPSASGSKGSKGSKGNGAGPSKPASAPKSKSKSSAIALSSDDDDTATTSTVTGWPAKNAGGHIARRATAEIPAQRSLTLDLDQFPKARQEIVHDIVATGKTHNLPTKNRSLNDWKSLKTGRFMNDASNVAAATAINMGLPGVGALSGFDVLKIIRNRDPFENKERAGSIKSKLRAGCDTILFTENMPGHHWLMHVYDKKKRTIETWDSMYEKHGHAAKLKKYIEDNGYGRVDKLLMKPMSEIPNQEECSCGAFATLFTLSNALHKPLPLDVSDRDAREFVGNALIALSEIDGMPTHQRAAKVTAYEKWLRQLRFKP